MSGMYQNAVQCMEKLRKEFPQRKLVCIDTKCASLGEGYLVREAMRKQAEGLSLRTRSVDAGLAAEDLPVVYSRHL